MLLFSSQRGGLVGFLEPLTSGTWVQGSWAPWPRGIPTVMLRRKVRLQKKLVPTLRAQPPCLNPPLVGMALNSPYLPPSPQQLCLFTSQAMLSNLPSISEPPETPGARNPTPGPPHMIFSGLSFTFATCLQARNGAQ